MCEMGLDPENLSTKRARKTINRIKRKIKRSEEKNILKEMEISCEHLNLTMKNVNVD